MARITTLKVSSKKRVNFEFNSPDARDVKIVGNFTDWETSPISMKKNLLGIWKASINLTPGRYEYKFLVDGEWKNDPRCLNCVPNNFGSYNCVIEVS